ncbi:MAG: DNA polymerase III subunit chi [Robiginitomaculum sp.]|nr:MAG: DNA polymerase III subunit chi [Robiginitomaculum sp.]
MGAVYFYHLTRAPVEVTLTALLGKARQAGWRVAVRGTDANRMAWLDEKLWQGPDDGFLPHGLAGGGQDANQPILLTCAATAANKPACVMTIDGAALDPGEVDALDRACVLFDGNDPQALDQARAQWKALTGAGCRAQYWSQESGSWQMMAEHPRKD